MHFNEVNLVCLGPSTLYDKLTLFKLLLGCMMKTVEKLQLPNPINFSKL